MKTRCIDCQHKGQVKKLLGCSVLKIKRDWFRDRECAGFVQDSAMLGISHAPTVEVNSDDSM